MEKQRKQHTSFYRRKFGSTLLELSHQYHVKISTIYSIVRHFPEWYPPAPLPSFQKEYTQKDSVLFRCRRTLVNISQRCTNPSNPAFSRYGQKGISVGITLEELIYLWVRDRASLLRQPSLDRINNDGNYTLDNCRFIELEENSRKGTFPA